MGRIYLENLIREEGGWISLERFMEFALYDPEQGYYSSRILHLGTRGDFSTAATLSSALARAILARYRKVCVEMGERLPLIEMGGGDGSLALVIKNNMGWWERLRARYCLVESSEPLRQIQKQKTGKFITHFETPKDALAACGGKAFLFSNELVDAFPARIFHKSVHGWQEVGLSMTGGRLNEDYKDLDNSDLPNSSLFLHEFAEGQRGEIHESFARWCGEWAPYWSGGEMVTIDYGSLITDLYYRRPCGTLRGYLAHNRVEGRDVYSSPGRMDLTCDVNFTDLQNWGELLGWENKELLYQKQFISSYSSGESVDRFLNDPMGAGMAFRVLIQRPLSSSGLSYGMQKQLEK